MEDSCLDIIIFKVGYQYKSPIKHLGRIFKAISDLSCTYTMSKYICVVYLKYTGLKNKEKTIVNYGIYVSTDSHVCVYTGDRSLILYFIFHCGVRLFFILLFLLFHSSNALVGTVAMLFHRCFIIYFMIYNCISRNECERVLSVIK